MYPHRIRLRGPWNWDALGSDRVLASGKAIMPAAMAELTPSAVVEQLRCQRRFGYPGRIDSHERVWVLAQGLSAAAAINLNGTLLGLVEPRRSAAFDATTLLQARNVLDINLAGPFDDGLLWAEVALEVRATAYLERVAFAARPGEIEVQGFVVGHCPRTLDLYFLAGRHCLAEQQVEATEAGTPFVLRASDHLLQNESNKGLRIELVDTAVCWYTVQEGE